MSSISSLRSVTIGLLFTFFLCLTSDPAAAQSADDSTPVSLAGGEALTVGGLLQTDAYFGRTGPDGFRARTVRVRFGGTAQQLEYVIQTDFASPSVLLDAFAELPITNRLDVTAGLFKAPYSGEILTARPNLLFAERSRAANTLAPFRQPGVTLTSTLVPERVTATVGVFNGPRGLQPNDNNLLLSVARLDGSIPAGGNPLNVGINAAYSVDDWVDLPGALPTPFRGTRLLFGADARLNGDGWLVSGEMNTARLSPEGRRSDITPFGFYVAGGIDVSKAHQVLVRLDHYDPDVPSTVSDNLITVGYNYEPSRTLRLQVNYEAPTDHLNKGFITTRLQVAIR